MLPAVPHLATQQVKRAWRQRQGMALEPFGNPPPQSQQHLRTQRQAGDYAELRPVSMPTDARAGIIADQQSLDEPLGVETCKSAHLLAQRQQPRWERRRLVQPAPVEVVTVPERGRQPLALPPLELEGSERRVIDMTDQFCRLGGSDELLGEPQPGRERRRRHREQVWLVVTHRTPRYMG